MKEKILQYTSKLKAWANLRGSLTENSEIKISFNTFSLKEKLIFLLLTFIGTVSIFIGLWLWSENFTVKIATSGGELSEGIIGSPRFINPVLAISDADRDLSSLVYSGLLRLGPDGQLIPDLAESYKISDDGRTYTFVLKDNLTWHDGKKLTARDVVFTVLKAQDPNVRSPRYVSWDGVKVEQSGEQTVTFTLERPYAPFLENLTMGIIPTHLWVNIDGESFSFSDLNVNPIGSGPYKVKRIKKDDSGIPIYYDLEPFGDFALGKAKISQLRILFYPNKNALLEALGKDIEAVNAITPEKISLLPKTVKILKEPLPRIFGLFFNQNQATIFTAKEVRQALNLAVNRKQIIDEVLFGFGTPVHSPLLLEENSKTIDEKSDSLDLESAQALLEKNGWKKGSDGILIKKSGTKTLRLEFSIATADTPELKKIAQLVKENWEALGAKVELKIFDTTNLNQMIIRPRKYDVLLFGTVVGRQSDLFAFWHSSGRLDPGLNIALYANITTDKLLEELRAENDPTIQQEKIQRFVAEIAKDQPAVFLYAPEFIYVIPKKIKNVSINSIADPAERLAGIYQWYIKTDRVWTFFTPKKIVN